MSRKADCWDNAVSESFSPRSRRRRHRRRPRLTLLQGGLRLALGHAMSAAVCSPPVARASCLPPALPRVWLPELSRRDSTFPRGTRLVWEGAHGGERPRLGDTMSAAIDLLERSAGDLASTAASLSKGAIELSVARKALQLDDASKLRESAASLQAEAIHVVLAAMTARAVAERLSVLCNPCTNGVGSNACERPGEVHRKMTHGRERAWFGAMLPLEGTLLEKLRKIEALHAGTRINGEREAAKRAAERIRARLAELQSREQETVFQYSLHDPWKRKLFVALCRRYGLNPYREPGQRRSTVLVRAPKTFQNRTLWPEYQALSSELEAHLEELTSRVISEAINEDVSEATETSPTRLLAGSGAETTVSQLAERG
jgi:hypothetical protein